MIPEAITQDIKNRAEIVEIIREFVTLKRAGNRYRANCPFHDERTPSFYVTPSKRMYKCFGCGKAGDVFTFLMDYNAWSFPDAVQWLARQYGYSLNDHSGTYSPPPTRRAAPVPVAPELPPSFIDPAIFQKSLNRYASNNLVKYLCSKLGENVVMDAVKKYKVGTSKNGGTVFWCIDHNGRTGTGKIILYPPDDHHRIKSTPPTWVHTELKFTDEQKYNWVKYWFGEHLLPVNPAQTVAIVESEKTALVCSIYLPGKIWLASGGIDGLNNREKWKVLKDRTVILYPDLGPPDKNGFTPFERWSTKADGMQKAGLNVSVHDYMENKAADFERAQKWDLADVLLMRDVSEFRKDIPPQNAPRLTTTQQNAVALMEHLEMRFDGIAPI